MILGCGNADDHRDQAILAVAIAAAEFRKRLPPAKAAAIISGPLSSGAGVSKLRSQEGGHAALADAPVRRYAVRTSVHLWGSLGGQRSASRYSAAAAASSAAVLAWRPSGLSSEAPGLLAVAYPPLQLRLNNTVCVTCAVP